MVHRSPESARSAAHAAVRVSLDLFGAAGFDGYFKRVNPAFERALGYSEEEICSPPFVGWCIRMTGSALGRGSKARRGRDDTVDFQNRYRQGRTYRWIEWMARAVASEQLLYVAGRDITDRKMTEHYLEVEHQATRIWRSPVEREAAPALLRVIGEGRGGPWRSSGCRRATRRPLGCSARHGSGTTADRFAEASGQLRLAAARTARQRVGERGDPMDPRRDPRAHSSR